MNQLQQIEHLTKEAGLKFSRTKKLIHFQIRGGERIVDIWKTRLGLTYYAHGQVGGVRSVDSKKLGEVVAAAGKPRPAPPPNKPFARPKSTHAPSGLPEAIRKRLDSWPDDDDLDDQQSPEDDAPW
jgi:hypothetical protein